MSEDGATVEGQALFALGGAGAGAHGVVCLHAQVVGPCSAHVVPVVTSPSISFPFPSLFPPLLLPPSPASLFPSSRYLVLFLSQPWAAHWAPGSL